MIAALSYIPRFTPAEYLDWEEKQELRYEYVDGEIYGMSGGTVNHGEISTTFSFLLKGHLRGGGCRLLNSDVKLQVAESSSFLYPDLSVTCDERDRSANKYINHPCLIVEILSPSTEAYDRGDKFALYRQSSTLQEYVLVSTNAIKIDIYRRNDQNRWEIISYVAGDLVELTSINLTLAIEQVYEDIVFEVNPQRENLT